MQYLRRNQNNHIMNPKITMAIRILFGVFCLVFGLNKFIGFMEFPAIPGDGGTLMGIYFTSGFLKLIGVLEILGGLLLLLNKYVGVGLIVLGAIMFNALVFHLLHDPANSAGAALGCILAVILTYAYRENFAGVFS